MRNKQVLEPRFYSCLGTRPFMAGVPSSEVPVCGCARTHLACCSHVTCHVTSGRTVRMSGVPLLLPPLGTACASLTSVCGKKSLKIFIYHIGFQLIMKVCSHVCVTFCIVPIVMQMQTMGLNPFSVFAFLSSKTPG